MALLVDGDRRLLAANTAARSFFGIDPARLPTGLLEVTREGRLGELLRGGKPEDEIRLTHRKRTVQARLVPGPLPGDTLLFLMDVSELRQLQVVRQEFVANLSHELKTPLTSLRLAAETLLGELPPAARQQFANRALMEVDYLVAIVENLRQLAEIEGGRMAIELSRFDLEALIRESVTRLNLEDRAEVEVPEGFQLTADRTKLAQALSNLIDNAARFSPPDAPVEIAASVAGQELRLTVRDHGNGISPEHWDRVFERFYKVDPSRTRETAGSGLGLAITKHLVLAQDGRVWTEAARDRGQVFGIALPLNGPTG
jgi:two-component system, OmpR family, phosphate regulon sensor histidine kinase PhoR